MRVVFPFHQTFQTSFGFLENLVVISLKVETGMRSSVEMRDVRVKVDSEHSSSMLKSMLKNSHFSSRVWGNWKFAQNIYSYYIRYFRGWGKGRQGHIYKLHTFSYNFLLSPTLTKLSPELNSESYILSRYIFTYVLLFRFWQLGQSELST